MAMRRAAMEIAIEDAARVDDLRRELGLPDTKAGWRQLAGLIATNKVQPRKIGKGGRPRSVPWGKVLLALMADYLSVVEEKPRPRGKLAKRRGYVRGAVITILTKPVGRFARRWGGLNQKTVAEWARVPIRMAEDLGEGEFNAMLAELEKYSIDAFTADNDIVRVSDLPKSISERRKN